MAGLPDGVPRWNSSLQGLERPVAVGAARAAFALPPEPPAADVPQGAQGALLNIFPWWLYKFASAKDFRASNLAFIVPAGANQLLVPNFSVNIPQGFVGVVQELKYLVQNPNTGILAFLSLIRGQQPIPGWDVINFLPAAVTTEAIVENDLQVRLNENDLLTAAFTNPNITAWTVGVEVRGWMVPIQDVNRLQGNIKY